MDGMSKVSEPGGTAASARMTAAVARLRAKAQARGEQVTLYSKTGTPTLETISPTSTGKAVEDLFAVRLLRILSDGLQAGVAGGEGAMITPVRGPSVAKAAAALRANPTAMNILSLRGVSPEKVAGYLAAFNQASTPAAKRSWLTFSRGVAVAAPRAERKGQGRSYVFVLRRDAGTPDTVPRGIAVAINIQQNWDVAQAEHDRRLVNHVAAALGTELLEGDLDRALWLDAPHAPMGK
jgi:hypothetical protein